MEAALVLPEGSELPGSARDAPEPWLSWGTPRDGVFGLRSDALAGAFFSGYVLYHSKTLACQLLTKGKQQTSVA